jgi:hypothetical protein
MLVTIRSRPRPRTENGPFVEYGNCFREAVWFADKSGMDYSGPNQESPRGLVVSALGAATLGASVFCPWYHLTLTSAGVAAAQQGLDQAVQQLNAPSLKGLADTLNAGFSDLAGHTVGTVSAHQVLKVISVILLILASIGLVAALLRLADATRSIAASHIASVGVTAGVFVVYRMMVRPQAGGYFSVSLDWGPWLALASCVAIVAGALWPVWAGLGSWLGTSDTVS